MVSIDFRDGFLWEDISSRSSTSMAAAVCGEAVDQRLETMKASLNYEIGFNMGDTLKGHFTM